MVSAATPYPEIVMIARTLLAMRGQEKALAIARRRMYVARQRNDDGACDRWLRVAAIIKATDTPI